jgi:hypothetical protein
MFTGLEALERHCTERLVRSMCYPHSSYFVHGGPLGDLGGTITGMPIPSDEQAEWMRRLKEDPARTVTVVATRIATEADALPALHVLRIGTEHFNRAQLRAVEVQLRTPEPLNQASLARAYITDSEIIDTTAQ